MKIKFRVWADIQDWKDWQYFKFKIIAQNLTIVLQTKETKEKLVLFHDLNI